MRWDERQRAILREMGLRLWLPPTEAAAPIVAAAADLAAQPGTAPAPRRADERPGAPAQTTAPAQRSAPAPALAPIPVRAAPASPGQASRATAWARPAVAASRPDAGAIAGLDWPALREAVAGCQACSLCDTRQHTVFGVGHPQAHCLVVGEAPGEQEDLQGEPFVGPAGQLLDRMLAAIGLGRGDATPARQVFITNTLKCRPPRNRNPTPEELAACQPFLLRQAALVQPRVILAMGRFAVQSLLSSDEPIGKLRGRVHRWQGLPLVVTYHPAYLLRNPADKAKAWDDLCRAAALLDAPATSA